jgi:Protein of unknown function (DUF2726)
MRMMTTLMVLAPIVIIAIVVWNYRRQNAAREAASEERMKAFLEASGVAAKGGAANAANAVSAIKAANSVDALIGGAATPKVTPAPVAVTPVKTLPAPPSKPQVVTGFTARAQLVAAVQLPVFQLLQSALPRHAVLPRMNLAAFINPPAYETGFALEAQQRRLIDATVDFLVCDPQLKPVAVVQCKSGTPAPVPAQIAFAAACAVSTGIRWIVLAPEALPPPEDIRSRVLGA